LALFRQQASIIAAKKEGTVAKIAPLQEQIHKLQQELKEKQPVQSNAPMLQGEDFKRYVSELRGKSTLFKRRKQELSAVDTEYGVLQRTEEVHCPNLDSEKEISRI
jgi:intraflagellar transport protein 81